MRRLFHEDLGRGNEGAKTEASLPAEREGVIFAEAQGLIFEAGALTNHVEVYHCFKMS